MISDQINSIPFVFFGSSRLSVIVLDELCKLGYTPSLIVTTPDKPQGRKLEIKPNTVKEWAIRHNIKVLNPAKLDTEFIASLSIEHLTPQTGWPLFVVASYGKIIPSKVIDLPKYKTLNIHPSLLPQYRGASPLPTAMLEDTKRTGVTIMQLDSEMDHGPIVAQKEIVITDHFANWPTYEEFETFMAKEGASLLANIIPDWINEKIVAKEQDHSKATFTKKITKEDARLDITEDELVDNTKIPTDKAYTIFRKIQAYHEWPTAYFFIRRNEKEVRVKITEASFDNNRIVIKKIIPEGKNEMDYRSFISGYLK